jgi:hypothetical protein
MRASIDLAPEGSRCDRLYSGDFSDDDVLPFVERLRFIITMGVFLHDVRCGRLW